jgi:hypothetical protein
VTSCPKKDTFPSPFEVLPSIVVTFHVVTTIVQQLFTKEKNILQKSESYNLLHHTITNYIYLQLGKQRKNEKKKITMPTGL